MAKKTANNCLNCALAKWDTTATGRLAPHAGGWCQFKRELPEPIIPKAMYMFGSRLLSGGHIDRRKPETDCPVFEAK